MQRYTAHIFYFFLLFGCAEIAYAVPIPRDSVFYKDTLVVSKLLQPGRPIRIGGGGSYGLNYYHDGTLPALIATSCDTFKTGKGNGVNLLLRADFPIGNKENGLLISPVLSYENLSADHTWGEFGSARDSTGNIRGVQFDHVITNSTKAIGLKALFGGEFLNLISLEAGPAMYVLFDQNYTKIEKAITNDLIRTPSGNVQQLSEGSGALPDAKNILFAFSFSLGAQIPLSKISEKLFVVPNVEFLLPLTQTTEYWSSTSLRFGLRLRLDLDTPYDTITEYHRGSIPVHIEIPEPVRPKLSASIEAVVNNREGNEEHVARLEVEEVKVMYAYPMLNYIFFDEGSAVIPPRYNRYASAVDAQQNFKASLDRKGNGLMQLHGETLNILGDRLHRSASSRITITGCTSNTGVESGNTSLAHNRAQGVQDYLVKIWQIDPKRIKLEARLLPEKPSPSNISEGEEENRRVEITSNDESLTDPLIIPRTEHIANPPNISLVPHISADTGIKSFRSSISIGGKELVAFNGSELKPWSIPEEALSGGIDSLDIFLEVTDSAGNVVTAKNSIKLEQKHVEREKQQELEKFSLILFAFDESVLGAKNERTLELVAESFKKAIPKNLSIIGYTDELGEANHNDDLSRRRAAQASGELDRSLRSLGLKLPGNVLIDGKGSGEKLYDNSLPEGRFFSRTVNITLEHGK